MHEILSLRKMNAGMLIKFVRNVNAQTVDSRDDLGKACHSAASEPFYYDTAYHHPTEIKSPVVIDETGRAYLSEVLLTSNDGKVKQWACSAICRSISDEDIQTIVSMKELFTKPLIELREGLQYIDEGCPHGHFVKINEMNEDMVDIERIKLGHPLACAASMCHSKLRVLRSASVHYPALRNMLYNVYHARKSHATIAKIDDALQNTNALQLLQFLNINEYETLVNDDNDLCVGEESIQGIGKIFIAEGLPHLETHLEVTHAKSIEKYFKKLDLDAEYPCCSCERLFLRTDVSFRFSTKSTKLQHGNDLNSTCWMLILT